MPLNADQLLAVFAHLVLTKIVGEPNLKSITLQQSEHNGNLASIKLNLCDGLTGLMVLSMKPDIFKVLFDRSEVPIMLTLLERNAREVGLSHNLGEDRVREDRQ